MTVIEFFDKAAIENMLSALLCGPDRVIFIGDSAKRMNRSMSAYREVLANRGLSVELMCRSVRKNDLKAIVTALTEIVEQEPECVFNLDGGEDLYLVAVGMVAQKYPDKVKLHRFNVRTNTITDCDADGNDQLQGPIEISVAENVRIYGGIVVGREQLPEGTVLWRFDEEFSRDLEAMWQICSRDPGAWNSVANALDGRIRTRGALKGTGEPAPAVSGILRELEAAGLIRNLNREQGVTAFDFKNSRVRQCLFKAGLVLELVVLRAAQEAQEDGACPVYNDAASGVYIDWDGRLEPEGTADVANEIDVLLMKGAVPVFISCKNGSFDANELYKLSQVARRFGGPYARMALVSTRLAELNGCDYIRARAADMGIRIIENLAERNPAQRSSLMAGLWK